MTLHEKITQHIAESPQEAFKTASAMVALDGLLDAIRAKSEAFMAMLDAQPQTRTCHIESHGFASLNHAASLEAAKPVYSCPMCEHEAMIARQMRRIEAAGIPADVRHATLANFVLERPGVKSGEGLVPPAKFREKAEIFAAEGVRNLVLAGTPGIGKGHLAAALAILAITKGQSVRWIECARLFSEYHRAYKQDRTDGVLDAYTRPALLVLDEIGLRDLPADGEEILFAILDARHKSGRQTILLGNKTAKESREWLGSRITDRLRSGGISFCYGEWESMRGKDQDGADF